MPDRDLRLQILNGPPAKPLVRIRGARCLLGGAPACTVRLRGFGVRPIHCIILRTKDGWTIRNLSAGNSLNGRAFRKAQLRCDDTLTLGPFAFRVTAEPDEQIRPTNKTPQPAKRRRRFKTNSTAAPDPSEELARRLAQIEQHLAQLHERKNQPSAPVEESERSAAPVVLLEHLKGELDSQRQLLDSEREAWRLERERLSDDLAQRLERLSLLESQLSEQQQSRFEIEDRLRAEQVRIAELQTAVEQSSQSLEIQRQQNFSRQEEWEATRRTLEDELADSRQQWAALRQHLEASEQQNAREQQRWRESELQLSQMRESLERLLSELNEQRSSHERQLRDWADEKMELERRLQESLDCADRERNERSSIAEQWQARCRDLELRVNSQQETLTQQRDQLLELQELRDELTQKCSEQIETIEQLQSQCESQACRTPAFLTENRSSDELADSWESVPIDHCELPAESDSPVVASPTPDELDKRHDEPDSSSRACIDSAADDVMSRLQEMGVWCDTEDEPPTEGDPLNSPPAEESPRRVPEPNGESPEVVADVKPRVPVSLEHADEDESIESYMNQLLQRLRGPDAAAQFVNPWWSNAAAPPDSNAEAPPTWQTTESPVQENLAPGEFRPRTAAPEQHVNLAAMRALANDTAHKAITTHKVKSQYYHVLLHMVGGLVTFSVAACFLHEYRSDPLLSNLALSVALLSGCYGLWKYLTFRSSVRRIPAFRTSSATEYRQPGQDVSEHERTTPSDESPLAQPHV